MGKVVGIKIPENEIPQNQGQNTIDQKSTFISSPKKISKIISMSPIEDIPQYSGDRFKIDEWTDYSGNISNTEAHKYLEQDRWDRWGNAIAQTASEVALGTLEGTGYLLDLPQWFNLAKGTEQEFDNAFSATMRDWQESVKEFAPIHSNPNEADFAPWSSIWWTQNLPSIASSLSLMAPAMGAAGLLRGLSNATKLTGKAARLSKIAKATGKEAEALVKMTESIKAAKFQQGISAAVFSRFMENTMETTEMMDQLIKDYEAKGNTPEEAQRLAGERASLAWYANSANLAWDIPQYLLAFKAFSGLKEISSKINDSRLFNTLTQMGQEGLEEAGQFMIQEEASNIDNDFFGKGFNNRLEDYLQDGELYTSMFFGAIGGGVFAQFQKYGRKAAESAQNIIGKASDGFKSGKEFQGTSIVNTMTSAMVDRHLSNGRTPQDILNDLEEVSKDPSLQEEDKTYFNEVLKPELEILQKEYDTLKAQYGLQIATKLASNNFRARAEQRNLSKLNSEQSVTVSSISEEIENSDLYSKTLELNSRKKFKPSNKKFETYNNKRIKELEEETKEYKKEESSREDYLKNLLDQKISIEEVLFDIQDKDKELKKGKKPDSTKAKEKFKKNLADGITSETSSSEIEKTLEEEDGLTKDSESTPVYNKVNDLADKSISKPLNVLNKKAVEQVRERWDNNKANAPKDIKDINSRLKEAGLMPIHKSAGIKKTNGTISAISLEMALTKPEYAQEAEIIRQYYSELSPSKYKTKSQEIVSNPIENAVEETDDISNIGKKQVEGTTTELLDRELNNPSKRLRVWQWVHSTLKKVEQFINRPDFNPEIGSKVRYVIHRDQDSVQKLLAGDPAITTDNVAIYIEVQQGEEWIPIGEVPFKTKGQEYNESELARFRATVWNKFLESNGKQTTQPTVNTKAVEKIEADRKADLKPLLEEKEQIEKEIDEIEKDSKGSEISTQVIEDTKKEISNLRNEDGSIPDSKIPLFNKLSKKIRFLQKSFKGQVLALIDSFTQLNNLSDKDIKVLNRFVELTDYTFEEVIQQLEKRNDTTYKRPSELEYFEDSSTRAEKLNESQESVDENTNKSSKSAAKELGIDLDKVYYANELDDFVQKHGSKQTKFIWNLIKNIAAQLKIPTKFLLEGKGNNIAKGHQGEYSNGQVANRASLLSSPDVAARTIVHELVHGVTSYIISAVKNNQTEVLNKLTSKQINAAKKLSNLLRELQTDSNTKDFYGSKNEHEILAELTHDDFTEALKNKKLNFVEKFLDYILDILGIPTNAYNEALGILKDMIENPIDYVSEGFVSEGVYYSKNESTKLEQLKQRLVELNKTIDKINAKYNAELKAVEKQTTSQETSTSNTFILEQQGNFKGRALARMFHLQPTEENPNTFVNIDEVTSKYGQETKFLIWSGTFEDPETHKLSGTDALTQEELDYANRLKFSQPGTVYFLLPYGNSFTSVGAYVQKLNSNERLLTEVQDLIAKLPETKATTEENAMTNEVVAQIQSIVARPFYYGKNGVRLLEGSNEDSANNVFKDHFNRDLTVEEFSSIIGEALFNVDKEKINFDNYNTKLQEEGKIKTNINPEQPFFASSFRFTLPDISYQINQVEADNVTTETVEDLFGNEGEVVDSFTVEFETGKVTTEDSKLKKGVSELFESNPKLASEVYEAMGLNTINESDITYTDEEGNLCAKMGVTNTTKGTGWKIVKDFKGQPKHSQGGVDISISDKGVSMRKGGKDIKAAHGLLIPNNN